MGFIDLHVHSSASDGTLSPSEVVKYALGKGLTAIALTDHDTTGGIGEALEAASKTSLELVPGTELSCNYGGKEIHMLGLYIDHCSPGLNAALAHMRKIRNSRNDIMLDIFCRDGISLTWEDLTGGEEDTVVTRAHFARALMEKGYVSSMDQAFKKYLEYGGKYCPPREKMAPEDAISLILDAKGFPVIAHPLQYKLGWEQTEAMISRLKEAGLAGIEVYYSSHNQHESSRLKEFCLKYQLLPTGGSDFHGSNKPDIDMGTGRGGLRVSSLLLDDIRKSVSRSNPQ